MILDSKQPERLEDRFALAVAFRETRNEDDFLFGRRTIDCQDYQGAWSLPSSTISKEDFEIIRKSSSVPHTTCFNFTQRCFGMREAFEIENVRFGVRHRNGYRLHIAVALCPLRAPDRVNGRKYDRTKYLSINSALVLNEGMVGTCVSLLIQQLVETGRIDSAISYLELSPDLWARRATIRSMTAIELWRESAANYDLLRDDEMGSDGEKIRALSANRYLAKFLKGSINERSSFLDLGCGNGELVETATRLGACNSVGIDLEPDPLSKNPQRSASLRRGKVEDASKLLPKGSQFSVVILNLVCQWISNIERLAEQVGHLMKQNGVVLLLLVPPEFAKNGHWVVRNDKYSWLVTEPLRRNRVLVMINRSVGPLWYYPRMTPDYISAFGKAGMGCTEAEYIFIDSFLSQREKDVLYKARPDLCRHEKIPTFLALKFAKIDGVHNDAPRSDFKKIKKAAR